MASSAAQAKGCIKGAVAGGVAGHFAHHTLMGAVTGCVAGHYGAKLLRERKERPQVQEPGQVSPVQAPAH
jgi:uncharacterized protein YcfJ